MTGTARKEAIATACDDELHVTSRAPVFRDGIVRRKFDISAQPFLTNTIPSRTKLHFLNLAVTNHATVVSHVHAFHCLLLGPALA